MSNLNYRAKLESVFNSTSSNEEEKEKAILELQEKATEYFEYQRRETGCGKEPPKLVRCHFAALQFPESQRGRANDLQPVRQGAFYALRPEDLWRRPDVFVGVAASFCQQNQFLAWQHFKIFLS